MREKSIPSMPPFPSRSASLLYLLAPFRAPKLAFSAAKSWWFTTLLASVSPPRRPTQKWARTAEGFREKEG